MRHDAMFETGKPEWTRCTWRFMLPLCVNLAEQTGHWKGFSSMWETRWDCSFEGKLNPRPHTSQWYRAASLGVWTQNKEH
jgi:hypothetical protein